MLALLTQATDTTTTTNTMSAEQGMAIFAGFGIFIVVMLLIGLVTFVFSIWMIVDAFGRKEEDFTPPLSKTIWIIILGAGILLGYGLIASVIYFFVVRKKAGKVSETNGPTQAPPIDIPPQNTNSDTQTQ